MFEASACYHVDYNHNTREYTHFADQPIMFRVWGKFDTAEACAEAVAKFPKFVKISVGRDGKTCHLQIGFTKNGVTGELNETGVKRVRKFLELAQYEWKSSGAVNAYATVETFLAQI